MGDTKEKISEQIWSLDDVTNGLFPPLPLLPKTRTQTLTHARTPAHKHSRMHAALIFFSPTHSPPFLFRQCAGNTLFTLESHALSLSLAHTHTHSLLLQWCIKAWFSGKRRQQEGVVAGE